MEVRERQIRDVTIVELAGRLTVNDQPGLLKEVIDEAAKKGSRRIALDLSGVRYIDSTRLGELIAAHITLSRQGGRLTLVALPPRIAELIDIAGLGSVFERLSTVEEAVGSQN